MKTTRPWLLFALVLALALGGMAWITARTLRAESVAREAQSRAALEEKARLALWRMDSTMALFLAPETARPWHHFEPFHREGGAEVPSPLLVLDDPLVLLRFQQEGQGPITSLLVRDGPGSAKVRKAAGDGARLAAARSRLSAVQAFLGGPGLREALRQGRGYLLTGEDIQRLRAQTALSGLPSPFRIHHGTWTPFWKDGDLFMARQVWVGDREVIQGLWLDWPGVKEVLLSTVRDFLPKAEVHALQGDKERRMGSLPVTLDPGPLPEGLPATSSRAALLLGWLLALAGAVAGGVVLHRVLDLSERKGTFASAVTHELRTPLTTFRLYTELLAHGMVSDPAEQRALLGTLLDEADRLDHLVKNVLAFARLDTNREPSLETVAADELVRRLVPRLETRAAQAGLSLEVQPLPGVLLRTDPLQVEQILFNLVDNAAKYAAGASDPRLHVEGEQAGGRLLLRVRDHGPGLDPADRTHLFRPFHKSVQKAARTAPGVGLGLALCQRLARNLGGDLQLEAGGEGACFRLELPAVVK